MKPKFLIIVLLFDSIYFLVSADENILCTSSYCSDVSCNSTLPERCTTQNSTQSGVYLPSVEFCNCCDYCLANLVEGEACSIGSPSSLKTTSVCGPRLFCQPLTENSVDGTCQTLMTNCTTAQIDYDTRRKNGSLGTMELRAECDDDGDFSPYKCIPGQTCYCQDLNGTRIFGEADYSNIKDYMSCECSRKYSDAVQLLGRELNPVEHFRCNARGDYDTIQCINSKCLCVDTIDGAPTYPNEDTVDIKEISNDTLPCYTSTEKGQFYKKCEEEYVKMLTLMEEDKNQGYDMVIGYEYPNCDLDGTYYPIQENSTHKICVDKEGAVLKAVNKSESPDLANKMDCKCVRALSVMTGTEKPDCDINGNYMPMQCRRGRCRCVDSDGNQNCTTLATCQEVDEIEKDQLKC